MAEVRRLTKSRGSRMLFGVAGGVAEYFSVDPVLVRLGFVALALANGIGLILYIIMAIVVPEKPAPATGETGGGQAGALPALPMAQPGRDRRTARTVLGLLLVGVGVAFLLSNLGLFWWFGWGQFWPIVLIAIGAVILAASFRRT